MKLTIIIPWLARFAPVLALLAPAQGATPADGRIPVLIVTGHSGEDIVQNAVQTGIHGYLVKPVTKTQLEKRIVMALTSPGIDPEILK